MAASTAVASSLAGACNAMAGGAGAAGLTLDVLHQQLPAGDAKFFKLLDCEAGLSGDPGSGGRCHGRGRGLCRTRAVDPTSASRCRETWAVTRYISISKKCRYTLVLKSALLQCSGMFCGKYAGDLGFEICLQLFETYFKPACMHLYVYKLVYTSTVMKLS